MRNRRSFLSGATWLAALVVIIGASSCSRAKEPIRFGATFPLTGEVASYGQKAQRGIELAVEEINAKGGLLGRTVVVDYQDDRNDKKEAVSIMTKFATIDKIPVVFGSAGSSVTLAIAPLATRHSVVLVSPISSSSKLSTEGGPYFFRTVPADDVQADVLSKWVFESGAKRVAIVYTNNAWGKPLAEGFQEKFKALGGEVVLSEGVVENAGDFRTVIAKLKKVPNLEAVVSPTYPKEGAVFVRQAGELGLKAVLFGGDNWGSPEFRNIAGKSAEGVFYTAPTESRSPNFVDFTKKYEAKYKEQPDVFGGYSYDAATAVFKAVEASGKLDATAVRDALGKASFMGVSGEIAFLPNGNLKAESFSRMTIKAGQPVPEGKEG